MANQIRVVIVGASGHGIAALDAGQRMGGCEVVGWLDSFKQAGETLAGLPVLGRPDDVLSLMRTHDFTGVFMAISNNYTRRAVWDRIRMSDPSLHLVSFIHPASVIAPSARVGDGVLVMAGAVINPGCGIGEGCIVNTHCSLDHGSEMKPFSSILPGVITGGDVTIGEQACICLGSTLSHRVKVGDHAYVGAASLVLRDIPPRVLAYGVPARVVRPRRESERHF